MGDNKISEAVARLERAWVAGMDEEYRDDLRAVLDHLQGEVVPVAWRYRHRRKNGKFFPWVYADSVPRDRIEGYQYEPLFAGLPAQGMDLGKVHAAIESLLGFSDHLESCGDSDSYNNAEFPTCGCGFDSAREQIWDALDDGRDAGTGVDNGK